MNILLVTVTAQAMEQREATSSASSTVSSTRSSSPLQLLQEQPFLRSANFIVPQVTKTYAELRECAISCDGRTVAIKPIEPVRLSLLNRYAMTRQPKFIRVPHLVEAMCFGEIQGKQSLYVADGTGNMSMFRKEDNDEWIDFGWLKKPLLYCPHKLLADPAGKNLYSIPRRGAIDIFSLLSLVSYGTIGKSADEHLFLRSDKEGKYLYVAHRDKAVGQDFISMWGDNVYKGPNAVPLCKKGMHAPITALDTYQEDYFISGHNTGEVCLWDRRNLEYAVYASHVTNEPIVALHTLVNGCYAVHTFSNASSKLIVLNPYQQRSASFDCENPSVSYVYSPLDQRLIGATGNNEFVELDIENIKPVAAVEVLFPNEFPLG